MTALSEHGLPEAASRRPFPPFTEKHDRLRAEIRRFVADELRPHAREWEDARWFPNDVFTRMAELGLLGLKYPRELGGRGGDYLDDETTEEHWLAWGPPNRWSRHWLGGYTDQCRECRRLGRACPDADDDG